MKPRDNFHRSPVYAFTMLRGNKCAKLHVGIIGEPTHPLLRLPSTDVREVKARPLSPFYQGVGKCSHTLNSVLAYPSLHPCICWWQGYRVALSPIGLSLTLFPYIIALRSWPQVTSLTRQVFIKTNANISGLDPTVLKIKFFIINITASKSGLAWNGQVYASYDRRPDPGQYIQIYVSNS